MINAGFFTSHSFVLGVNTFMGRKNGKLLTTLTSKMIN